ncbi:MAG: DUF159 family protein [Porticoccaceae bacterium]|nr:DUF159 family protein [Porticoccaceae bacterium]
MCGRYNITDLPGLQELLEMVGIDLQLPPPRYNIAPTEDVLLLHDGKGELARWWMTPSWAPEVSTKYSMFNARCETLTRSRAFQKPFKSQRGIVPMSSFIEWRTDDGLKQPWLITNEAHTLAVAALWDVWQAGDAPLLSCTLVTTEAAPAFKPWHNRMPVMLGDTEIPRWMDNSSEVPPSDPLFRPELKYDLTLHPLSKAVGNARNKDPRTMEPFGDPVYL